ncbi:MAG: HAMP domain-containing sensor histidine kinase [Chloroflexota bacterium]
MNIVINVWVLQRLRQGKKDQAGQILTIGGIILINGAVFVSGGLYSSANLGLLFMFVTGIVLVDFKIMRWISLAVFLFFIFMFVIEYNGYLPDVIYKDLPLRVAVLISATVGLLFIVSYHKYALLESGRRMAVFEAERERYQVQNELTQNLAHDLRTPISVLKSKMYLIRRYVEKGMPVDAKIDELEAVTDNMHAMIEDLLALTMLDSESADVTTTVINLQDLITDSIASIESYAQTENIQLIFDNQSSGDISIKGNPKQLSRVMTNLMDNAVHYGQEGGYVKVQLRHDTKTVSILIEDDGIGIAPEHHEQIFERFYRVNQARTIDQRQGTGIGLSIVRKIIQGHGGQITVQSALGEGTTFVITLPR